LWRKSRHGETPMEYYLNKVSNTCGGTLAVAGMKNIFLFISIIFNIIIIGLYLYNQDLQSVENRVRIADTIIDYEITSSKNFEAVFIFKNDSIYNRLWSEAFENQPEKAFLISTSYFYVTGRKQALKNIETSKEQLETIYHKKW
jgi:hypothetical protein